MANRTATSVLFGFDFQANAAIVLMLENIKDMTSIRLEGTEDIEINLNDGSCLLAQAKAVVNSSTDFSNVLSNLKKSITSLSEAEHKSGKCYNTHTLRHVYQHNNILTILLRTQRRNKINILSDFQLFTFHLVSSFSFVRIQSYFLQLPISCQSHIVTAKREERFTMYFLFSLQLPFLNCNPIVFLSKCD